MTDIILIGGAAGTGKTTLAKKLAKELGLPWISTDQICSILQIEEADHLVRLEKIWNGTNSLITNHHPWEGAIIEGTAILPQFVARDLKEVENIQSFFLAYTDTKEVVKVIEDRSALPWIHTKTPEQKAVKIAETLELDQIIVKNALEFRLPLIQGNEVVIYEKVLTALKS